MAPRVHPHEHVVFVYEGEEQLLAGLEAFTRQALANDELVVFVHAFPTYGEARSFLARSAEGLVERIERELFLVSFYKDAFEGAANHIDFDHVVGVVEGLLARARAGGQKGLAIYVDASRIYLSAHREEEWFRFEERLGRKLHHALSLVCAYPSQAISAPPLRDRMLLTHLYRFEG